MSELSIGLILAASAAVFGIASEYVKSVWDRKAQIVLIRTEKARIKHHYTETLKVWEINGFTSTEILKGVYGPCSANSPDVLSKLPPKLMFEVMEYSKFITNNDSDIETCNSACPVAQHARRPDIENRVRKTLSRVQATDGYHEDFVSCSIVLHDLKKFREAFRNLGV